MKPLIKPKDGIWVYSKDSISLETVPFIFRNLDVGIFDLDDCDAKSPAKKIAYDHAFSLRALDPMFGIWAINAAIKHIKKGKCADSEIWGEYIGLFLRNHKNLQRVENKFNDRKIMESMLYPGVESFYSSLPNSMFKLYLTRNIREVGRLFADHLKINMVYPEVFNKKKKLEHLIEHYTFNNYLIKEDFSDDGEAMIDVLEHYKRFGKIKDYSSILVADSPGIENDKFDFVISQNHLGMARLITSP